jgi:ribosomal-protein-alanine N-acetyltransferase
MAADNAVLASALAPIETPRLRLVLMTPAFLQACVAGDWPQAERELGVTLPPDLYHEGDILAMRLGDCQVDPAYRPWSLRAILGGNPLQLQGHIGFHARPGAPHLATYSQHGIELGYTVFPAYRRQGIAQEALQAMIAWACTQAPVDRAILSIGVTNRPSLALAEKLGFTPVGQHTDPEDGLEWVYALNLDSGERQPDLARECESTPPNPPFQGSTRPDQK